MKSRALESWQYGDPAKVAEIKEAVSCKGCAHSDKAFGKEFCTKGRKHGAKCARYKEQN